MSKCTFFLAIVFATFSALMAQPTGDIVVFSEDGYRFFLIINGVQQNDQPQTNVRLTNLPEAFYSAKVIFEDARLGEIRKNALGVEGMEETTYRIKRKKSGELDLAFQSTVLLASSAPAMIPDQQVVTYHATPAPQATVTVAPVGVTVSPNPVNPDGSANVSVNVPGFSMGVQVDPNGNMNMNMGGVVNGTVTTNGSVTYSETYTGTYPPQGQVDVITSNTAPAYYQMPGYGGPIGCPWPMNDGQFSQAQQTVGNQSFEENKLEVAKQIVNTNCLTSNQVKAMMSVFDFEQSKLDFAKYCYSHTFDLQNYYIINDAFDFSNSVSDLNAYISAHPVQPYVPQQVVVAPGPGYPGGAVVTAPGRCAYPMQPGNFAQAKSTITKQSFEQNKLEVAKQVFNSNCITSAQVKEIMLLFSFENSRLDFAKYAYGYTYDPQNYYQINDAFQFSSSVSDLNKFIGR